MSFTLEKIALNHGFDEAHIMPGFITGFASEYNLNDLRDIMPEAKSVLLLIKKHSPYKAFPKDAMAVHSHYPEYQKAYTLHKSLIEKLNSMDIAAKSANMLPLKAYAAAAGCIALKNTLAYHKKYGSYFVLQAIAVDIECEPLKKEPVYNDICLGCDICEKACPTGAIVGDGRIVRKKCIRDNVPVSAHISGDIRRAAGRGYIGCGICQSVCPANAHIKKVQPPRELSGALGIEDILDLKSDSGNIKKLQELIGKNEARPGRTIATACMAAGNTGDKKYAPHLIRIMKEYINPLARGYAAWALGEIGGYDNALEEALIKEHNEDARNEIKGALLR